MTATKTRRFNLSRDPHRIPDTDEGNLRLLSELEALRNHYEENPRRGLLMKFAEIVDALGERGFLTNLENGLKIERDLDAAADLRPLIYKPFGPWKDFDDCVEQVKRRQGYSDEQARRVCGKLKAKLEKK